MVLVAFQVLFIAGFGATPGKFMAGTAVVPTGTCIKKTDLKYTKDNTTTRTIVLQGSTRRAGPMDTLISLLHCSYDARRFKGSAGLEVRPSPWDSVKRAILKTSLWAFGSFFFAGVIFGDKLGIYDRMSGTEVRTACSMYLSYI